MAPRFILSTKAGIQKANSRRDPTYETCSKGRPYRGEDGRVGEGGWVPAYGDICITTETRSYSRVRRLLP